MIELFEKWYPLVLYIAEGAFVNIYYTFISVSIGLIFAIFLALGKVSKSKALRFLSNLYTSIFRGTPLLIQLFIIYYVLPGVLNIKISVFMAAITALSLNSAAYVSEILRSGINAVDKGQFEAAKALGLPQYLIMKDIIFPQAICKILPSLINELINMLKETAVISMIGEVDILKRAQLVAGEQYNYLIPMLTAAICYYVIVLVLTWTSSSVEKRIAL